MPHLRRNAFSTPNTTRWTSGETAEMRLDSLEAQEDAIERFSLLAARLPGAQDSARRLDCITGHQKGPILELDSIMSDYENNFQTWKMPRRVAEPEQDDVQRSSSRSTAYAPVTSGVFAMPAIPEIVVSQSPAQFLIPMPGPRPHLKRKSDDSLRLEQPCAQRPHLETNQDRKRVTRLHKSLPKSDNLHALSALEDQSSHQSLSEAAPPALQLHRSLPKGENLHAPSVLRNHRNSSSFPGVAPAVQQHYNVRNFQPQATFLGRTLEESVAFSSEEPMPTWMCTQQVSGNSTLQTRPGAFKPSFRPQRNPILPPLLPHYHRAAPPPLASGTQEQRAGCLHWNASLTQQVCEWLQDPGTDSRQTDLTAIIFRNVNRTHVEGCRATSSKFKLKMTRMTISKHARMESVSTMPMHFVLHNRTNFLDWFVIEFSEVEAQVGRSRNYWLMAFPVCAITQASSRPAPTVRPDDFRVPYANVLHTTTWTLGRNRMPVLHGHGVMENWVQDFFDACMLGQGQIEMESVGPLFSHD